MADVAQDVLDNWAEITNRLRGDAVRLKGMVSKCQCDRGADLAEELYATAMLLLQQMQRHGAAIPTVSPDAQQVPEALLNSAANQRLM